MRSRGQPYACGALLIVGLCLAACGDPSADIVVRVGDVSITRAAVEHRMSVMRLGGATAARAKQDTRALRQQALDYLISSQWLLGEAADQRLGPTRREIELKVDEKRRSEFPGGEGEFRDFLKAANQTVADVEQEAAVEVASERLRRAISSSAAKVTPVRIANYYQQHKKLFVVPEQREVRITNRKTKAAAEQLEKEVRSGSSFVTASQRELISVTPVSRALGGETVLDKAIDAAVPNVLVGPIKLRVDYFVFELKRVAPAFQQTLAEVRGAIERQLVAKAQQHALVEFVKAWRTRWRAKTDCDQGYVVMKCKQYNGPTTAESPSSLN